MPKIVPIRSQWLIWLAALIVLTAVLVVPISNRVTRTGGLILFGIVWFGLIFICWRRSAIRYTLLGITLAAGAFVTLPSRAAFDREALRADYLKALRRYDGTRYFWGGENFNGIDCSGLVRRGLIEALFVQGIRTIDPGPVRRALSLWWHDSSAAALRDLYRGLTIDCLDTRSINAVDHSRLKPGDLAVTQDGVHIMAYLGGKTWIEADPGAGRVITVQAPANDNLWFGLPMKIVRWSLLEDARP